MPEKITKTITTDVDADVWKQIGVHCAMYGGTKKQVLDEALRLWLAEWDREQKKLKGE